MPIYAVNCTTESAIYVMEHRLWDEFLLQLGFVEWKIELDKISRKD